MAAMTEEWVSFWIQCLAANMDYSAYCDARIANDTGKIQALELRFPHVKDIFEDFGNLDLWGDTTLESPEWTSWFQKRKHLFMVSVREISVLQQVETSPGHVMLEVPMLETAKETTRIVGEFISDYYSRNSTNAVHCPSPKYTLHSKAGRVAHGYEKVRQACVSAARSYRYDFETSEELRHREAITEFVRHEIDTLGWTLDPKAKKRLLEAGELSDERFESFKAMLNRCRRDFMAFARNTIRARFPDDSQFDSDVLDMF